jgi:hypothetical protein
MQRLLRRSSTDANRRGIGRGDFDAAGCLPLGKKFRGIPGRAAICRDQHLIFATSDRALSPVQAVRAHHPDAGARRTLLALRACWTDRTLRSCRPWRTGIALWAGWPWRARVALGPLSARCDSQRQHSCECEIAGAHAKLFRSRVCPTPGSSILSQWNWNFRDGQRFPRWNLNDQVPQSR